MGRNLLRGALSAATALGAVLVIAQAAAANVGGQTVSGSANPASQHASASSPASLDLSMTETYDDSFSPSLQNAVFHLDNDFTFDTTGFTQCQQAAIQFKFHAAAVAACPNSVVGSGTFQVNDGAVQGIIDIFSGGPPGGTPLLYLNFDVGPSATSFVVPANFGPSSRGGDFGTQMAVGTFPNTPGLGFTRMDLHFPNPASAGSHLVNARCQADQRWDLAADFSYYMGAVGAASGSSSCSSIPDAATKTGKRAAALKKCKKKRSKKARSKCRKKAKKLPA
jgi:hypothetical protein